MQQQRWFQRWLWWYACCFSSEDLLGKERDKGVMNLPSKKVRRLAGRLKEFNRCRHTMGELRALIFLLGCPRFADMRDACVLICCFFHLAGKISMHGIFRHADMSHIGPKLACRRSGTKYCVDCFFYFRTLWNSPPAPPTTSRQASTAFWRGKKTRVTFRTKRHTRKNSSLS
jgi:hypothetical protein